MNRVISVGRVTHYDHYFIGSEPIVSGAICLARPGRDILFDETAVTKKQSVSGNVIGIMLTQFYWRTSRIGVTGVEGNSLKQV